MSDGAHYDVPHPDFLMVSSRSVLVGINENGSDLPDDYAHCNPVHITRIEPIPTGRKGKGSATRKPRNKRD